MRALSIRQPWAYAIALGWKTVENRDWQPRNPGRRFRGPFLIHAGQREEADAVDFVVHLIAEQSGHTPGDVLAHYRAWPRTGGFVGAGVVTDLLEGERLAGRIDAGDDWLFGPVALVVEQAQPLNLIPANGAIGFFDVPADLVRHYLRATTGVDEPMRRPAA